MLRTKPKERKTVDRAAIINAVKTPLGFFVLVVLVVEMALGGLAAKTEGQNQLVALYGMLLVILALIAVVSFFAYRKPEALFGERPVASQDAPEVGKGVSPTLQQLQDFCSRISGHWWERIIPEQPSALSFVEIRPDSGTSTVKMKGKAYSRDGNLAAIWETVASCINLNERKVFYQWRGWHPSRPNEPYEGFGEISFHESPDRIDSGVGVFSDTNVTDMKSTTKKSVEFQRSMEQEVQVLQEGNSKLICELIRKKLDHLA